MGLYMKVLWLVDNINQVGGVEQVVLGLSNYFVANGIDVEIISRNTEKSDLFFELSQGVKWQTDTGKKRISDVRKILKQTNAIIKMISNRDTQVEYAKRSLERSKQYSLEKVGTMWLEMFNQLSK